MIKSNIIAISRHRIGVDGTGVTTLVAFHGCTQSCKYCLNPQSLNPDLTGKLFSPEELYKEVKKDSLYFLATGGGITFGGGEPLIHHNYIKRFHNLCSTDWKINIETALNVPKDNVYLLLPIVNQWIVDIKDMNNEIYQSYTGKSNEQVVKNLTLLSQYEMYHKECNIKVKVPHIPGFITEADIEKSIETLMGMGIIDIERLEYLTDKNYRYVTRKSNL